MESSNPTAAILVIGDEILTGRTREGNAWHLAGVLANAGFDLREIRVVPDDHAVIVAAIRALDKSLGGAFDHLFTSGGIGPTHDDLTADAVADAFGVGINIDERALAAMRARYEKIGVELNDNRMRMARIPDGAELIENAVSAAPGFSLGGTHVLAGVPEVFRAMIDTLIPRLVGGRPLVSREVEVMRGESEVAEVLADVARSSPRLSLGSYPFSRDGRYGTKLVVRGLDGAEVEAVFATLCQRIGVAP